MANDVVLVCGDVNDRQLEPLLKTLEPSGPKPKIVRLSNEYAIEGVESEVEFHEKYGNGSKGDGGNVVDMMADQWDILWKKLRVAGKDATVKVIVFEVKKDRHPDAWAWVDSFFRGDNVPYWWLETTEDGKYTLTLSSDPSTILYVPTP